MGRNLEIMYIVKSKRLGLKPMTSEIIEAALNNLSSLEKAIQSHVLEDFLEPVYTQRVLPIRLHKTMVNPDLAEWYGFIVELESNTVVGTMGFKMPPDEEGLIEIGYGIHHTFQGKGYATEMAVALIDWAFQQKNVKGITATNVLKNNHPSIKILEKLGMQVVQQTAEKIDYILLK